MTKDEIIKEAKEVLKANPSFTEVYVTKDGQCFTTEDKALNHAKEIIGAMQSLKDDDTPIKVTTESEPKGEKPLDKMTKAELLTKAESLAIKLEGTETNKVLVELIIAALETEKSEQTEGSEN